MGMNLILQMFLNGLVIASVYILLAVGFNLAFGIIGILNFAHGYFYVLGGFLAYYFLISLGLNFYVALFAALVCIFVLAAGVLKGLLEPIRQDHLTCGMLSLGLCYLLEGGMSVLFGGSPRIVPPVFSGVAKIGGVAIGYARLSTLVISLVIFGIFIVVVYFTRFGRAVRATGEDPEMAAAQGINVSSIFLLVFCIATVLAGAGGALASYMTPLMPHMGFDFTLKAFVIIVLGGFGSIPGAVLGALLVGFIESFIGTLFNPVIAVIVSFGVVLVIFLVRPSGLLGIPSKIP